MAMGKSDTSRFPWSITACTSGGKTDWLEGARSMMLRPVKLDAARYPGTGQTDQRRLDDAIVIDEVKVIRLVARHLHAAAELRQQHNLEILVLKEYRLVADVGLFVGDAFYDGMGMDDAAAALIYPVFQEHRILLGFTGGIRRYHRVLDTGNDAGILAKLVLIRQKTTLNISCKPNTLYRGPTIEYKCG